MMLFFLHIITWSAFMNMGEVKEGARQGTKGDGDCWSVDCCLCHTSSVLQAVRKTHYALPLSISSLGRTATLCSSSIIKWNTMLKFRVSHCSRCATEWVFVCCCCRNLGYILLFLRFQHRFSFFPPHCEQRSLESLLALCLFCTT